jgi:hypothetical protein
MQAGGSLLEAPSLARIIEIQRAGCLTETARWNFSKDLAYLRWRGLYVRPIRRCDSRRGAGLRRDECGYRVKRRPSARALW